MTAADPAAALPVEIHEAETIVRAVKTPHHVNPAVTRIRPSAFRPAAGHTVLSVMRQLMGDDFCKDKGVEICGNEYIGLAAITAAEIRRPGSLVVDYRHDFLGHAHIDHQLPAIQRDEPPPADVLQKLDDRCKKLAAAAVFHKDQAPTAPGWSGPALKLASLPVGGPPPLDPAPAP
jgi:hypothetical protein